jgi:hypothetical protein
MNQFLNPFTTCFTAVSVIILFFFGTFLHCIDPAETTPEFTLVATPVGKRYVAYISSDREVKPDTITASWNTTGIASSNVTIDASIDSGANWFPVTEDITLTNSTVTLKWFPGNDTNHFSYFGEKNVKIRISDTTTAISHESGYFPIIGALPVELESPEEGEALPLNDTIILLYRVNTDRISRIRTFFISDAIDEWVEFTDATTLIDDSTPPFKTFNVPFIPLDYDTTITNHIDIPIRFMLKDYNSPLPTGTIITGDFTIAP